MGDDTFPLADTLNRLRRSLTRREETKAEGLERVADWWEAIHSELVSAHREQFRGGHNFRLGSTDLEYAHAMSVWMRYQSEWETWKSHPDNRDALAMWETTKAAARDEESRRYAESSLPDHIKTRLVTRPRSPRKWLQPVEFPRDAPGLWPAFRPVPWSQFLSEILVAVQGRAGADPT